MNKDAAKPLQARPGGAAVELRRVTKRFGPVVAVDDVTLSVNEGEFLTLLGPSGCGKTTLLRLIGGFDQPDSGIVLLAGAEVTHVPPYGRDVNQVFQSYALFPHLTVRENIGFGLRMQGHTRDEISRQVGEALDLVALPGFEERKPHELSGGQRQRVALARALAPRPAVLLLDEPLSALDPQLRHATQLELKSLQRRLGTTFVLVTHDQDEALAMSDRIALMNAGRIEQLADARTLYLRPATAFAAGFVGRSNIIRAERLVVADGWTCLRMADGIELRVPPGAWPAHLATALVSIRPERITLSLDTLAGPNAFRATVNQVGFRGAVNHFQLTVADGVSLTATSPHDEPLGRVAEGQLIWCRIRPEDLTVLPG